MTVDPQTNETGAAYSNYSDMYAIGMYKIRWWKEEPNKPYKLYARVTENSSALRLVAEFDTLGEAYKRIYELTRELQKETPDWQPFGWRGDYIG